MPTDIMLIFAKQGGYKRKIFNSKYADPLNVTKIAQNISTINKSFQDLTKELGM